MAESFLSARPPLSNWRALTRTGNPTVAGVSVRLLDLQAVGVLARRNTRGEIAARCERTFGINLADRASRGSGGNVEVLGIGPGRWLFLRDRLESEFAAELGLARVPGLEQHIRPYLNGRDLNGRSRGVMVIDLHGLSESELREQFPEVYQWVLTRVKPERDHNNERYRREDWWLFGRKNTELRLAISGLRRFITTAETSHHRFFVFLPEGTRPDNMLVNIGLEGAFFLGVLSSNVHVLWAVASGGRQGVGDDPRYNKTLCFDRFLGWVSAQSAASNGNRAEARRTAPTRSAISGRSEVTGPG